MTTCLMLSSQPSCVDAASPNADIADSTQRTHSGTTTPSATMKGLAIAGM